MCEREEGQGWNAWGDSGIDIPGPSPGSNCVYCNKTKSTVVLFGNSLCVMFVVCWASFVGPGNLLILQMYSVCVSVVLVNCNYN